MTKMKKVALGCALAMSALVFTSCGKRVEVPTAHVGFVKTKAGIEEKVYQPSSFKLPHSWTTKPQLICVATSTFAVRETFSLFLPKDRLKLSFDVRGTLSVRGDKARQILDTVPSGSFTDGVATIDTKKVYTTYASQVIRTTTRNIISKYDITECLTKRSDISKEIMTSISKQLADTPIKVNMLGLASISPPEVVVVAQENARKREIALQEAEANKLVSLKEAESRLEVAKKQQEIDLLEAETQVLVEKKLAESVSKAFVTQRALKVMEKMAGSTNKVFIIPNDALQNPAVMMGINAEGVK